MPVLCELDLSDKIEIIKVLKSKLWLRYDEFEEQGKDIRQDPTYRVIKILLLSVVDVYPPKDDPKYK